MRASGCSPLTICVSDATALTTSPLDPVAAYASVAGNYANLRSFRINQAATHAYFWCITWASAVSITQDGPGIRVFARMDRPTTMHNVDTPKVTAASLSLTGANDLAYFSPNPQWLPMANIAGIYQMEFDRQVAMAWSAQTPSGNVFIYPPLIVPIVGGSELLATVWKAATVASGTVKSIIAAQLVSRGSD